MGFVLVVTTTATLILAINLFTKEVKEKGFVFTKEQRRWIGK